VFDPNVDQQRTRMYYRLVNDKESQMGGFPLPKGKVRLFIKEPKADAADTVRSQAFLGEDWAQYTPLFAPLDLYVGVAQDVKVERFTMDPEGGPKAAFDEITAPRFTIDGKESVTKPQFRNLRSRFAIGCRLQGPRRATDHGAADDQGTRDGEWWRESGAEGDPWRAERGQGEGDSLRRHVSREADRRHQRRVRDELPPTTIDKKYDLYITILRKMRRHSGDGPRAPQ